MAHSAFPNGKSSIPGDLVLLTAAWEESNTNLRDELVVLADSLAVAVPSFLGVTITLIIDEVEVTLSDHDSDLAVRSNECLDLPYSAFVPGATGTVMFYAADVRAFADLAAVVTRSAGDGEQVPTGGQRASLRSPHSPGVTGLVKFSIRNQAIGVLIDQGYTPEEARTELNRRATRDGATVGETAQDILDHLVVTTHRAHAVRGRTRATRQPARRARKKSAPGADLTARERDVLRLLVDGLSTAVIAAALLVLPRTVSDHINSIMTKLGTQSRVDTVAISLSDNILGTG